MTTKRRKELYCGLDLSDLRGTLVQYRSRIVKYTPRRGPVRWLRVVSDTDSTICAIHPTYWYAVTEVALRHALERVAELEAA